MTEMLTTFSKGKGMIFVGGSPRSGTTLMQRILGSHSSVYAGPEFDFVPTHILPLRKSMIDAVQSGRISPIVDEEVLDRAFQSMMGTIFEEKLKATQKSVFCEKTPANALVLSELEQLLPEARFIMMIRDPRKIVNSMRSVRDKFLAKGKRPPRFVRSVAGSVQEVNRYHAAALLAAQASSKIMIVHYEDIIQNPQLVVEAVCKHVGLAFEPGMVEIEKTEFVSPTNNSGEFYTDAQLKGPIGGSQRVTQNNLLSDREERLVELYTQSWPELDRYQMSLDTPGVADRLAWEQSRIARHGVFLPRNH